MTRNAVEITVTIECANCGGSVLELPDKATDDSIAVCQSCDTPLGRYGDLKTNAMKHARAEGDRVWQDILGRLRRKR